MGKNQHVVPHKDGWAIKGAGNQNATKVTKTQKEAINVARDIAKKQKSELVIHNTKGVIRQKNSLGKDPNPPKG